MTQTILLVIGLIVGGIVGFFIGKSRTHSSSSISSQEGLIGNLTTQIAEIRTKFEEVEKSREKREGDEKQHNKELLKQLRESNKDFLEAQDKQRVETESKRDAQLLDIRNTISKFTQTISGTQKRGNLGEFERTRALLNLSYLL